MQVELKRDGDDWSVVVNGRRVVEQQGFAVANSVAEALRHPEWWEPTEAYEVAESILRVSRHGPHLEPDDHGQNPA